MPSIGPIQHEWRWIRRKTRVRPDHHVRKPPRRENVRALRFKVLNRAEITKYKALYPESVYLSTVIKNLETADPLSAYSRVRE
jgi:hypothetical protein